MDGCAPTLRAESHQHEPIVLHSAGFSHHVSSEFSDRFKEEVFPALMAQHECAVVYSAGFKPGQGKAAHGLGYEEEKAPTPLAGQEAGAIVGTVPYTLKIRSGKEGGGKGALVQEDKSATLATHQDQTLFQPAGMMFESHPNDSRVTGPVECAPAVVARYGTGGGNTPLVAEPDYVAFAQNQRNEVRDLGEKSGALASQPGMKQQTYIAEKQPVAFGVCAKSSKGFLSENPNVGFYEAGTSRTLDTSGGNPSSNQGGMAVVEEERTVYCSSVGSFMNASEEVANMLMARDYKDPQIINDPNSRSPQYIVRRLTPTECARLQGMPDWWCDGLETEEPSEEDIAFWRDVFETWRMAMSPDGKPKTDNQIRKWLRGPFSDSEIYKMWGNGIALPCGHFVLSGIAEVENMAKNAPEDQI